MHANQAESLALTPIDHVFTGSSAYPVGFAFHYDYRIDAERLQSALAGILPSFHTANSRLVKISESGYALHPSQDGLKFDRVSKHSQRALDLPSHTCVDSVETREDLPLCHLRLTETADGSTLGISFSHVVADGFSCFYFLSELAKAFRQEPLSAPSLDRSWYQPRPLALTGRLSNNESLDLTGFARDLARQEFPQSAVTWETLYITEAEITDLLATASTETNCRLSKNDVLTAYLWKLYLQKWRGESMPITASFGLPFDVRRFPEWVSPRYFGNGICLAGGQMDFELFLGAGLGELASLVRSTVDKVTVEYARRSYDVFAAVRQREGLAAMEEFHVADPVAGILVTNLSRVPLESVDFGGGAPFSFATVANAPRTAIVLPAEDGVKVDVCLPRPA